jgi:hypothetical protein
MQRDFSLIYLALPGSKSRVYKDSPSHPQLLPTKQRALSYGWNMLNLDSWKTPFRGRISAKIMTSSRPNPKIPDTSVMWTTVLRLTFTTLSTAYQSPTLYHSPHQLFPHPPSPVLLQRKVYKTSLCTSHRLTNNTQNSKSASSGGWIMVTRCVAFR